MTKVSNDATSNGDMNQLENAILEETPELNQLIDEDASTNAAGNDVPVSPTEENALLGNEEEDEAMDDDAELERIRQEVKAMEDAAKQLRDRHGSVITTFGQQTQNISASSSAASIRGVGGGPVFLSPEERAETDERSACVRNVDYGATAQELEQHFHGCGPINRVTILTSKGTGHPKGFAYVEFADRESVEAALRMTETLFRGRLIVVERKRTNVHGITTTERGGFRGRGRGFRGFRGNYRGRSRGFRSRRGNYFSPY